MSKAEELFYRNGCSIVDIAKQIGKTRQTIANHLKTTLGYQEEKEKRKLLSKERKRQQNRKWAADNPEKKKQATTNWINKNPDRHKSYRKRESNDYVESEILRREHDMAVKELGSRSSAKSIIGEFDYYRSAYNQSTRGFSRRNETVSGALIPYSGLPKYIKG